MVYRVHGFSLRRSPEQARRLRVSVLQSAFGECLVLLVGLRFSLESLFQKFHGFRHVFIVSFLFSGCS